MDTAGRFGSGRAQGMIKRGLPLCLAMLPAALLVYLGHFSRPWSDDWRHILLGQAHSPLENALHWRERWNGAYGDYVLHSLLAPLDWLAPAIFPALIIFIWVPALSWLLWQLLAGAGRKRLAISIGLASLAAAASINAHFSPESLYWYSSSARYIFPLGLFTALLAFMLALARRLESTSGLALAGGVFGLLAFGIGGFSEVHLIFQSVFLASLLAVLLIFLPRRFWMKPICLLGGGLLGSIASGIVQWTAPGRLIRMERVFDDYQHVYAIRDPAELLEMGLFDVHRLLLDADAIAGLLLVFGVALLLSLRAKSLSLPAGIGERAAAQYGSLAYVGVLLLQLAMLPPLWAHSSDDALVLSRFSLSFAGVVGLNIALIAGCLLVALRYRQFQAWLSGGKGRLGGFSLGLLLLAVAMHFAPSLREVYILARNALLLMSLSLITLAWWQWATATLDGRELWLRLLPLLATCIVLLTAAVMISVPRYFLGNWWEVNDGRTLAAAAYLIVSQGLIWGFALGYACRRLPSVAGARVQLAALLLVACAFVSIVSGQLRLLPDMRLVAEEWDERHALLLDLAAAGQRDVAIPAGAFDLWHFMETGLKRPGLNEPIITWQAEYYGLDSVTLVAAG